MGSCSLKERSCERFFDENSALYGRSIFRDEGNPCISKFLKKHVNPGDSLLDIGGGNGSFACAIKRYFPDLNVTVVDQSEKLMAMIPDERIRKIKGSLPAKLNISGEYKYISCLNIFHHIVGDSIQESNELLRTSLMKIRDHLEDEGYLIVHEMFYDGYLLESLPRLLIFNILSLQNRMGIKIPSGEFLKDLSVCFYPRDEFRSILKECGFGMVDHQYYDRKNTIKTRILLTRAWGSMDIIAKKTK